MQMLIPQYETSELDFSVVNINKQEREQKRCGKPQNDIEKVETICINLAEAAWLKNWWG